MGVFKKKGQQPLLEPVHRREAPAAAVAVAAKGTAGGSSSRKGSQASLQLLPRFSRFQRVGSKDSADTRLSSVGSDPDQAPEYEPPPPFEILQGGGVGSTGSLPFRTAAPASPQFQALGHEEEDDDTLTADGSLIRGAAAAGSSSVVDSDCGEYEPPPPTLLPPAFQVAAGDESDNHHHQQTPADDETTVEGTFRQFVFDPAGGIAGVEERKSDPGASDIFRIAAATTLNVQSTTRSPAAPDAATTAAERSSPNATLRRPSFDAPVDPASVFNGLHDDDTESAFDAQHPPFFPALAPSTERSKLSDAPVTNNIDDIFGDDFQTHDPIIDRSQKIVDELFSPERQRPDDAPNRSSTNNQASKKVPKAQTAANPFRSGGSVDSTSFLDKGFPLRTSPKSRKPTKRLDLASLGPLTRQPTDDRSVTSRGSRQSYAVSLNQRHTPTRRRPPSPENTGDAFKVIDATVRPYSAYAHANEGSVSDAPSITNKGTSLTADRVSRLDGVLSSAPRSGVTGGESILSNANATVFSRAVRTEAKLPDPFEFPLDEVDSPVNPFKIGKEAGASAWDVEKTPTFETNASDPLIDSIRRASSRRSQDCDSSTRTPPRPDPSPRGRPEASAGVRAEATRDAPEVERKAVNENTNPETLGIQPSGSDGAMEKPAGQLNRAILGSMLCRQMDSLHSMEGQLPVRPPSQLLHRSRATASPLRPDPVKDLTRVPSTIEKCGHDCDATVSDVTEAVSSHYLTSFEAWKSQARSALSQYGGNLRLSYQRSSSGANAGPTQRGPHPTNRVTWMSRVQEEHQRMFLASSEHRAEAGSGAAGAPPQR